MAYQVKYKFQFESIHDVFYGVSILEDGFAGTATTRPLGKAPTLRMAEGDPFRATSLDLDLECQVDGEFASLYTSDPLQYKVEVRRGGSLSQQGSLVWSGFVATELYAEPNIAPPYDVHVTATDGLGTLKEYIFEGAGLRSVAAHFRDFLSQTGLSLNIDMVSSLAPASGTPGDFMDNVYINLDHMAGENVYDVLKALLESIHATITQSGGRWLVIRETDFAVGTGGDIAVYRTPASSGSSFEATISARVKSVGKMGVADMWPVGQTTRRVVPAKNRVIVESTLHPVNGADSIQDDVWMKSDNTNVTFVNVGDGDSYYLIRNLAWINDALTMKGFNKNLAVTVRSSRSSDIDLQDFSVVAKYVSSGGTTLWFSNDEDGWMTTEPSTSHRRTYYPKVLTSRHEEADETTFTIPAVGTNDNGGIYIYIYGYGVRIFDVTVTPITGKGYRDTILLNNGSRGETEAVDITGGWRPQDSILDGRYFFHGVFLDGSVSGNTILNWSDGHFSSMEFLSIQAMSRALSVALPRIETEGTLDIPSSQIHVPIAIYCNSAYSIIQSYEWNLVEDELRMKALTLPAASITVTSETITSTGNAGAGSSGGSSGGGGGGISEETDPVFTESPAHGITDADIQNWNGKSTLPTVSSSDNGKVLKVVSGAWAKGTDSGYVKPSTGIPSSDMAAAVQTSLGKADSALQSVPSDYKKVVLLASESDMPASPDSDTLYLIPET